MDYCPGHLNYLSEECWKCREDYNPDHHPNNYDCFTYKLYFFIRDTINKKLKEKDFCLSENVLERVVINLFLRQLINPNDKNLVKHIDEIIENGLKEDKERREYLKNSKRVCDGKERISVGLV